MDPINAGEGLRTCHAQEVLRKVLSKNKDALAFRRTYTLGITILASLAAILGAALGLRTSFRGVPLAAASIGIGIMTAFICLAALLPDKRGMIDVAKVERALESLPDKTFISDEHLKKVMTALCNDENALRKLSRSMSVHQKEIAKAQFPHIQFK